MRDPLLIRLGQRIRHYRLAQELSQEDLATISGLHRTYIGGVERGERNIGILNVIRIAKALKITPSDLLKSISDDE